MPPKQKSATGDGALGRSLIRKAKKDKAQRRLESAGTGFGIADIKSSSNALRSVTQVSSLEDFVANAVLSDRQFIAERSANFTLVGPDGRPHGKPALEEDGRVQPLRIPRRPKWTVETSKEQLEASETRSFLEWRAAIAQLEENEKSLTVTPFEKNLEVWKQLWRVVERSDIVVQIVDARNPTFFRCPDLEEYIREVDEKKQMLILVNKSDFLTDEFRYEWGRYFESQGVQFLFFSAKLEQEKIDIMERQMNTELGIDGVTALQAAVEAAGEPARAKPAATVASDTAHASEKGGHESEGADSDSGDDDADVADAEAADTFSVGDESSNASVAHARDDAFTHRCRIIGREELIDYLVAKQIELVPAAVADEAQDDSSVLSAGTPASHTSVAAMERRPLVVGMVGFPNVGKSSTINALVGASSIAHGVKRVSVGCTPGKTKHFQTLTLCPQVTLCDCPGLVFPSFVTSTAEMIVNGVLPIAHMRDHAAPMRLVCQRIPRRALADYYGLKPLETSPVLYAPPSAFLDVFCHARGFMASYHAGYDHPRGGRHVLMDYMMGKLLYCFPPPTAPHLNIYSHIIEEYESEQAAAAAAEPMVEELPADNMTVTTRTRRVMNVLDVPDTAALFSIPVPKPKSQRVSVMTSRHRARKGARDPDPYGTQAVSDPLTAMVLEESKYYTVGARPDKLAPRPSTAAREVSPDSLIGKGKGRANATTFTRVHRPYSAK